MKIPTQKGEHSCKCRELSLKWKDGIVITVEQTRYVMYIFCFTFHLLCIFIVIEYSCAIFYLHNKMTKSFSIVRYFLIDQGWWKQKGSKCYWIKKQIEHFHFHLSTYLIFALSKDDKLTANCVFWPVWQILVC